MSKDVAHRFILFLKFMTLKISNQYAPYFPGGPTSQHDTIELRGFEDANDIPRSKKPISKNSSKPSKSNLTSMSTSISLLLNDFNNESFLFRF